MLSLTHFPVPFVRQLNPSEMDLGLIHASTSLSDGVILISCRAKNYLCTFGKFDMNKAKGILPRLKQDRFWCDSLLLCKARSAL